MFKALLIKEWKEKASLAAFGLGLIVVFLAAFLMLQDKRDLNDLIAAGFLLLVFPFIGLLLGASAFETEFRDGTWAFLLSRPLRKETIWLAKLVASLAYLAALWGAFLVLKELIPALGAVISGFSLPIGFRVEASFLPLAIVMSLFYFSIAFSFSMLSEKPFSVLFGALFVGFVLQALLTSVSFALEFGVFMPMGTRSLWLPAHQTGLVLMALALLGASLWTFRRADFSQPKRKAVLFARSVIPLVVFSWIVAFTLPLAFPKGEERFISEVHLVGDKAFFSSGKGIYRYDAGSERMKALTRSGFALESPPSGTGKLLYFDLAKTELWTMNEDGSGKKRIVRAWLSRKSPLYGARLLSGLFSPDGRSIAFAAQHMDRTGARNRRFSIWSVATDGADLKELPLDPALAGEKNSGAWFHLAAWPRGTAGILLTFRDSSGRDAHQSLWTYDPSSGLSHPLFESTWFQPSQVSSGEEFAAVIHWSEAKSAYLVGLLDLKTKALTDILDRRQAPGLRICWNPAGDRLAILDEPERGAVRLSVYSLAERRIIVSRELMTGQSEFPPGVSVGWVGDGKKLCWNDPRSGHMRILAPDLSEEKTIAIPAELGKWPLPKAFWSDVILVSDERDCSLWRLDLKSDKWRRIW